MAKVVQCRFRDNLWETTQWLIVKKAKVGEIVAFRLRDEDMDMKETEWAVVEVFDKVELEDKAVVHYIK